MNKERREFLDFLRGVGGFISVNKLKREFGSDKLNIAWDLKDAGRIGHRYNYLRQEWEFYIFTIRY